MFTGLVEEIGRIARIERRGPSARITIATHLGPLTLGESVAVDGVCLTVDQIVASGFEADASVETLARSTLGARAAGHRVHLERATPLGGRMGGHIVGGHVDGPGRVTEVRPLGEAWRLELYLERELAPYVAAKGSIALDGVSLTLNGVDDRPDGVLVDLVLVPHTVGSTKLGSLRPGDTVNVEVDVLARYVARQLAVGSVAHPHPAGDKHHDGRAQSPQSPWKSSGAGDEERDERILRKLREGGFA